MAKLRLGVIGAGSWAVASHLPNFAKRRDEVEFVGVCRKGPELLEKIKKTSSAWIKHQGSRYGGFFWQGGYGDFSIGWSQLEGLVSYIDRQEQHHRTQTFQEEYRTLLQKYQVEFHESYVWD